MRYTAILLTLASVVLANPLTTRNNCINSILNDSYLDVSFGQSRSNIDSYTRQSIQSLVLAVNHSNGQILDGIPNLPGHLFYWQSQNAWTAISQYEAQQNSRDLFIDVLSAQNALSKRPGDAFDKWGVPLVNTYNDDAGWAALSNVQAYEAYGREIFLKRAIDVWNVRPFRVPW